MILQSTVSFPKVALAGHQKVAFAILTASFFLYWRQPTLALLGLAGLVVLPLLGYLVFRLADGDAKAIMFLWVGLFPLAYHFLSFHFITFDLLAVLALAAGIALCPRSRVTPIPSRLRHCGWAWFSFISAALLSVLMNQVPLRIALQWWFRAFVLPPLLAWYVIACFPVDRYLRLLHGIICVGVIYSAAVGLTEVYLGRDLFVAGAASEYFAGQGLISILRVTGPYSSNHSFGLIGLITFCLLGFLRSAMDQPLPRWQRVLHGFGVTAALLQAMMPLFRSIFISIIVIFGLDLFRRMKNSQKVLRIGVLAVICAGTLIARIYMPELFEERVSGAANVYARIAQQQQNLQLFFDNPVIGVGLTNFYQATARKPALSISYGETSSLDSPHSNVGAVLAETGTVGFIPYALSQCLLVAAFWKLRVAARHSGKLVWISFIVIFLSYWISGLTLTSGYYSDLNLWFIFSLAVIYKYGMSPKADQVKLPVE